jgi:hypothetical protein
MGRCGLDASGSGQGPEAASCEHDNEHWGSMKTGTFFDWLSVYQLLKNDSAARTDLSHITYRNIYMYVYQCTENKAVQ